MAHIYAKVIQPVNIHNQTIYLGTKYKNNSYLSLAVLQKIIIDRICDTLELQINETLWQTI